MKKIRIVIGSDHGGFNLKSKIITFLEKEGYEIKDIGTHTDEPVDYPAISKSAANEIVLKNADLGILICGTGLGMAISANKVKGIRAISCSDTCSAKFSKLHNNANILCFGERIIGEELAKDICKIWLETPFEGGRHQARVDMFE